MLFISILLQILQKCYKSDCNIIFPHCQLFYFTIFSHSASMASACRLIAQKQPAGVKLSDRRILSDKYYLRTKIGDPFIKNKCTAPLIPALITLKPTIKGIRDHTADAGAPINIGVITILCAHHEQPPLQPCRTINAYDTAIVLVFLSGRSDPAALQDPVAHHDASEFASSPTPAAVRTCEHTVQKDLHELDERTRTRSQGKCIRPGPALSAGVDTPRTTVQKEAE